MTAPTLFSPVVEPAARARRRTVPAVAGGVALAAAPALLAAGLWTDPPQPTQDTVGYLQSLVEQPVLGLVSANLLHYGWVAFAFGVLALLTAVPAGARGRVPALVAAIAGGVGAVQMSGELVSDWFATAIAQHVGPVAGAPVFDASYTPDVAVWNSTSILLLLVAHVALIVAAARARLAPLPLALTVLLVPAGMLMPTILLQGLVMLLAVVPFGALGLRIARGA
jgi:hypothetical protein